MRLPAPAEMALSALDGMTPSPKAKAQILSRVYSPTSSSPSVVKLAKLIQKTRHRTSILFISSFEKAAYKYFNYFGPWTADVQGPPLNSCVMNVVKTDSKGRPVKNRTLPRRAPAPLAAPRPAALTSSFAYFFTIPPGSAPQINQPKLFCIQSRWKWFIVMALDVFVGPPREFSATLPGTLSNRP